MKKILLIVGLLIAVAFYIFYDPKPYTVSVNVNFKSMPSYDEVQKVALQLGFSSPGLIESKMPDGGISILEHFFYEDVKASVSYRAYKNILNSYPKTR